MKAAALLVFLVGASVALDTVQGVGAARRYADEVRGGAFPAVEHSFGLKKQGGAPEPASASGTNVVPLRPVYGPAE